MFKFLRCKPEEQSPAIRYTLGYEGSELVEKALRNEVGASTSQLVDALMLQVFEKFPQTVTQEILSNLETKRLLHVREKELVR